MTGSQTDPVSIPLHEVASAALLRLANPFFKSGHWGADEPERAVNYGTWLALRAIAQRLANRRALELTADEMHSLDCALLLCPLGPERAFIRTLSFGEKAA